jgi:hypothetical protein
MSPCPEVLLGALGRLTKRIRLGFGVRHRSGAERKLRVFGVISEGQA